MSNSDNKSGSAETDINDAEDEDWESIPSSVASSISSNEEFNLDGTIDKLERILKDIEKGKINTNDVSTSESDEEGINKNQRKKRHSNEKLEVTGDKFCDKIFCKIRKQLDHTLLGKLLEMDSFLKSNKVPSADLVKKVKGNKGKPPLPPKPWVEKYRPKTVDDVVEQTEIVSVLKQVLKGADLPHFLFYGPPGTGKTSTIMAAARELFGDSFKDRILELNASDDRGIQVIRDKVKSFAQLTASSKKPDGSPCPPYKIVILDEADSMTHAAQAALRRTMEKETKTTRFCLICNYVSSIINPLTSRCMKFRFKPLGEGFLRSRLEMICLEEKVKYQSTALTAIVNCSQGDLRYAITCLQSCARLKLDDDDPITESDVFDLVGVVPEFLIQELLEVCKKGSFEDISKYVQKVLLEAYPVSTILDQLQTVIISSNEIPDEVKAKICERISVISSRIQEGACDYLQLVDLCCRISNVYSELEK